MRTAFMALLGAATLIAAALASDGRDEPAKPGKAHDKQTTVELPSDDKADAEMLKLAGKGFKLRNTPNFVICYNTSEATLKSFISRVEVTYKSVISFAERMGVETRLPTRKLQILFCDQLAEYEAYGKQDGFPASEGAPGFYNQLTNRSAFFNYANATQILKAQEDVANLREEMKRAAMQGARFDDRRLQAFEANVEGEQERINRMVVQHEVAHQVLFNIGFHARGPANPRWFTEGVAMMFETPPTRSGAGIGAINQGRLGEWLALERDGKLAPLESLISDPALILPSNPDAVNAYAQAWALVHYLQRTKRAALVKYVDLVRARKENRVYRPEEELATFTEAFGSPDKRFTDGFIKYVKRLPYRPRDVGR